jgi:hypothetical protein
MHPIYAFSGADFLLHAFNAFPDRDFLLLTLPRSSRRPEVLRHFMHVTPQSQR